MKLLYTTLLLFCLPVYSLLAQQELLVSLNVRDAPLLEVFSDLEDRYAIRFSFSNDAVDEVVVSARIRRQPLAAAMTRLLDGTPLNFRLVQDRYVLIIPKEEPQMTTAPVTSPPPAPKRYTLEGSVVDIDTGEGLPFANVQIIPTGTGGTADIEGVFQLQLAAFPEDSVEVSYLGYEPQRFAIHDFVRGEQNIRLKIQSFGLANVVVTAYLMDGIDASEEARKITFSPDRFDVLPGQAEPDVLQAVLLLPGVSSPGESVSDLNIRGGTADQNLVLWDGIPLYHTGHYFGAFTAFNPYIVDRVEVWRGGQGAQYGGRLSGVIDIKTREEHATQPTIGAGLNLTHGHLHWELPFANKKATWLFSARRSFTDVFQTISFVNQQEKIFQGTIVAEQQQQASDDELTILDDLFFFNDLHTKLLWTPTDKDQLSFSFLAGENNLRYEVQEDELRTLDNLNIANWGALGQWRRQWSEQWQTNIRASHSSFNYYSEYDEFLEQETRLFASENLNDLTDQRLRGELQWMPTASHQFIGGFERIEYSAGFGIDFQSLDNEESFVEDRQSEAVLRVGFLDYTFQRQEKKWMVQLGVRSVNVPLLDERFWEPRLNVQYQLTEGLRLKASAGLNHQFVNQLVVIDWNFTNLGVNNQIWTLIDNDDFPVLRGRQLSAGFDLRTNGWFLDVEAYAKDMNGLTSFSPAFSSISLDGDDYSQGKGQASGIDILLRKRWGNHHSWISYTSSTSEYFFAEFLPRWIPAFNDLRHQLSWVYTWKKAPFDLSVGWYFHSGKPYTPNEDIVLEEITEDGESWTFSVPIADEINSAYLPAYHRLDVSGVYTFPRKKERSPKTQVGLSVINLYNQKNIVERRYGEVVFDEEEEAQEEIEVLDRNLLPFTPNVFFRIEW